MKKLLNTLYVTTEDAYLSLNGETVEVIFGDDTHKQIPLHTLNGIVSLQRRLACFNGEMCRNRGFAFALHSVRKVFVRYGKLYKRECLSQKNTVQMG